MFLPAEKLGRAFLIVGSFIVLLFASLQVHAKQAAHLPLVEKSMLFDVVTKNDGSLVAVGERGHILLSQDGTSWTQANVPVQVNLMRVNFVDNNVGWAVGHEQTILKSEDGGLNWKLAYQQAKVDRPLFDIRFFSEENAVAVGAYGLMLETQDGGESWTKRFLSELLFEEDKEYLDELKMESEEDYQLELNSILPHFNQLLVSNGHRLIVGEAGLLAESKDAGKSWQRIEEIYLGSFFSGHIDHDSWLVAGLRGHIFTSTDAGINWAERHLAEPVTINAVKALDSGYLLLGNAGHLYRLDKDGQVIAHYEFKNSPTLLRAVITDDQQLVIASSKGMLTLPLSSISGS